MGIASKMTAKQENTHQQEAPPPAVSVAANATVTNWSTFVIHLATSSNASHILIYIYVWTPAHHPKNTSDIFKFESKIRCSKTLQNSTVVTDSCYPHLYNHQLQEKRNLFCFLIFCVVYCVLLCTVYCVLLCTVYCVLLCTVYWVLLCIVYCVLCAVVYCVLCAVVYCVLCAVVYCVLCTVAIIDT
jgi:hypothetical protein